MQCNELIVAKLIKTDVVSIESIFLKPFLDIDSSIKKIVIFLASPSKERITELNGTKFFYSPISSRKKVKQQAEWVARILKEEHVDIIHCEQHSATVIGVKAKKIAKTPYLFSHVHGNNMARGFSRQLFYRFNKKHITKVIACSEFIRNNILGTYPGYNEDKVVTLANGIDLEKFNAKSVNAEKVLSMRKELGVKVNEKMFLATCRLSPDKNLHLLFNAFAKVCQGNENIKLFVAGEGRLKEGLSTQIASLKMEDKITLLGFRTDIKELLSVCDVIIQPSRREGFSISILEAAAMAKPIIFSNTGGAEVLEGICDQFIITPNKEDEIQTAIQEILILDTDELEVIGNKLEKKVNDNYTFEIMTKRMTELYKSISI